MSKLNEKMKEVKENVVNVETAEVKDVENETENEEFMTVKVPKAKGYAMLANGEATEIEAEKSENEAKKEEPKNEGLLKRAMNSKAAKVVLGAFTVAAAVGAGIAMGKNGKNSDNVTFEDVPPQGLPDNYDNYQTYDEVNAETEENK